MNTNNTNKIKALEKLFAHRHNYELFYFPKKHNKK